MIHGIINVNKEPGFTSHDVVAKLRGITRQKKIGHTGTLDPEASGVLPVCLGKGTKLCELLTDHDKEYEAVLLLGQVTDTQDTTGTVLETAEVKVTEKELLCAVNAFAGGYMQLPPMYSALKVQGKRLYELARAGVEVERKARHVEITQITVKKIELPRVWLSVACGKGTYIRTLCHDIGQRLGCGGCMEKLTRTRVGAFTLGESYTLAEIEAMRDAGTLEEHVLPVDAVFDRLDAVHMLPEAERLVRNGNFFSVGQTAENICREQVRVYAPDGEFLGVYRFSKAKEQYVPEKMFLT